MKAVILAAGVGKRFGKRTQTLPKCLIPLGDTGENLLQRAFGSFRKTGLKNVVIVCGHLREKIKEECRKSGKGLRIRFIENPDYRRGSILSLHKASKELSAGVLIMDADVYFPAEALGKLLASPKRSAFLLDAASKSSGEEMMVMAKKGRLVSISKRVDPSLEIVGEATGIVKLAKPDALLLKTILGDFVKEGRVDAEYEEAYARLMRRRKMGYETMDGFFWSEMDFEEDLRKILRRSTDVS
ncbi:MAG: phosphocholine cytidylyltransferase family protein [Candidatus Omnitrophica bacterium]|nr:phosphocholine cytidylyltransferase family protein [Candidatus Omnitrophota bacterium]